MAEYLVLARKYRSSTFDEVVGQEPISTTLKNAIATGRIAQAFLFTGTRGVGKTSVARILAKALNCLSSERPTPTPCNTCDACVRIARGDDMDVIEIDGASNRGIDEIRDLRSNAVLHPSRSRYRIYYIDEVHMLTKEAFNALLKTLEEPPPHVKFIFATTEAEKVPATILSRCQRFDFRNIPTNEIAGHLREICKAEKIAISEDAIFRVARAAAGSMRDGVSLLDQLLSAGTAGAGEIAEEDVTRVLGTPPDERIASLIAAIANGQTAAALEQLDGVLAGGYPLEGLVAALADQFRNIMLALTCGASSNLIELAESQRQALGELAKKFTVPSAVHAVGVCEQLGRSIRGSSSARALTEAAVVRLSAADKFVDAASLIQRLERLSGSGGRANPADAQKKNSLAGPGPATSSPQPAPARPAPAAKPPENGSYSPVSRVASASSAPAAAPSAEIVWQAEWLSEHWSAAVAEMAKASSPALAGLVASARVMGLEGGRLRLGFDAELEAARQRAAGSAERINAVMTQLAGRAIECEFVSSGLSGRHAPIGGISTEDRTKVANDPAVKAVLDLFGGQLADVRFVQQEQLFEAEPEPQAAAREEPSSRDELADVEEDE